MLTQLRLRLMLAGTVLLLVWLAYLATISVKNDFALRERENAARGQIVADSLANSISRAVGYGIDLIDLSGIDQVFANRIFDNRYIVEIVLDDLNGQAQVPALKPIRSGASASAVVKNNGKAIGRVTVYLRPPSLVETASAPISAVILIMLAVLVTAWEGINYATRRGPELREEAAANLLLQMTELDFRSVIRIAHPNRLDIRWVWLSTQIRDMNERFIRIFRLVESLRQTEPSIAKQMKLLGLAKQARGDAKFATGKPLAIKLSPIAIDVRWLSFVATTSLSVNLFVPYKGSADGLYSGPLTLGLCILAVLLSYGFVQQWVRSRSAQEICLAGLVVLGGTPLLSFAISAGGVIGVITAGQVDLVADAQTRTLSRVAMGCLQAVGLGVFFAGLRRFVINSLPDSQGWEKIPVVVLSALALVGASLTWIWGDILGSNGMTMLSFGLTITTYFFYAISPLEQRATSHGNERHRTPPMECLVSAAVIGFALGTVIATVVSGTFPAGQIDDPLFFSWPLIAMGLGFFTHTQLFRLNPSFKLVLILLASIATLASIGLDSKVGLVTSMVALMLMTSQLISLLSEIGGNLNGGTLTETLSLLSLGAGAGLIAYAICIYLGYHAALPWTVSTAGVLALLATQRKTFAKAGNVT